VLQLPASAETERHVHPELQHEAQPAERKEQSPLTA
jgi:hypothetical protein